MAVRAGAGVGSGNTAGAGAAVPRLGWRAPVAFLSAATRHALERRRGFLLFPFAVMTGLLAYRGVAAEPHPGAVAGALAFAAAWSAASLWRRRADVLPMLAFGLAVGFALLPLHGALFGTPMLAGADFGTYRARISEVLDASQSGQRLILSEFETLDGDAPRIRRARLFVRDGGDFAPGDVVEGRMRLAEVPGPALPGGYDAQFHAYFDGIGSYGNATGPLDVVEHRNAGLAGAIATLRHGIGARIDRVLAGEQAAIARALTIGDQSRIPDETRTEMATAGIAHVLAISGLHLTLVAGAAFAALRLVLAAPRRLSQRFSVKKWAAAAGIGVVLVYLAISGASVSATRASVMLILVFGAVLAGRRALTMRNVALAALFVLATEPAGLFRPGFQLSFAAVAALIGVYENAGYKARAPGGWLTRIRVYVVGLAVTSVVAGLATAVFAAYHFQQTAPLGLAGNLVALPLLGFVVLPSLVLGVLVMPFGLEPVFLIVSGWGIDQILAAARMIAAASAGIAFRPLIGEWALLAALAAAAWFVFFQGWLRMTGPVLAAVLILAFGAAPVPDVLIADRTLAAGIRQGEALMLMSGRKNSFVTDVWSETYGLSVEQGGDAVACDTIGCIGTLPGGAEAAVVTHIAGFLEDCDSAALVVTRRVAPAFCRAVTAVVDRNDLQRGGVTAAYLDAATGKFVIAPSILDSNRPWRIER